MICDNKKLVFVHIPKNAGSSIRNYLLEDEEGCSCEHHVDVTGELDPFWIGVPDMYSGSSKFGPFSRILIDNNMLMSWHQHMVAERYLSLMGEEKFNSYLKFAVIRDPWEWAMSWFFWSKTIKQDGPNNWVQVRLDGFEEKDFIYYWKNMAIAEPAEASQYRIGAPLKLGKGPTKLEYYRSRREDNPEHPFDLDAGNRLLMGGDVKWILQSDYVHLNGKLIVDRLLRFESLASDFKQLGFTRPLPHDNKTKVKKKEYKDYYTTEMKNLISNRFEKDIDIFKYSF